MLNLDTAGALTVAREMSAAAQDHRASALAGSYGNVDPYVGLLQPMAEPLIPAKRWYLFAEPPTTPVYVYGYLNGAEGPQVTTGPVPGADGVEVSVIFYFDVGTIDWRGAWFNPGT